MARAPEAALAVTVVLGWSGPEVFRLERGNYHEHDIGFTSVVRFRAAYRPGVCATFQFFDVNMNSLPDRLEILFSSLVAEQGPGIPILQRRSGRG
jgi:hypothetical protein